MMTFEEGEIIRFRSEIDALLVEVEGMKSANQECQQKNAPPAFSKEAFDDRARRIRSFCDIIWRNEQYLKKESK